MSPCWWRRGCLTVRWRPGSGSHGTRSWSTWSRRTGRRARAATTARTGYGWPHGCGRASRNRSRGRRGASALTAKQAETALLSAAGVPRREIAAKLGVSESVVRVRLRAVYAKAGTDGGAGARERLAAWLREQGMLP